MNPDTLALLGPALLANVAADLAAGGLFVPTRRVFSHGEPVRDCDQLAVWIDRGDSGSGGSTLPRPPQGPTYLPITHITTWGVDVSVCAAERTGTPSTGDVMADGVLGARYLWVLTRALTGRWKDGTMFAPYVGISGAGKGVTVSTSTGAMDGAMVTVTVRFSALTVDV